jgi:lipoate-protein ligase A
MSQPDHLDAVDPGPSHATGLDSGTAVDPQRSGVQPGPRGWSIETTTGSAQWFHDRDPGSDVDHRVWIHRIPTEAVVLGSAQHPDLVRADEAERRGVEVCRRRSGGGLVHIQPQFDLWIDIVIPRLSPLWDDDIGRSFHWLGRHWAHVLQRHYTVHGHDVDWAMSTGAVRRPEGRLLCFADVGYGEVLHRDRKVVGLSQRRTRHWARLQGLMLVRGGHHRLLPLLEVDAAVDVLAKAEARLQHPKRADAEVGDPSRHNARLEAVLNSIDRAVGLPPGCPSPDRDRVVEDFCRSLPAV